MSKNVSIAFRHRLETEGVTKAYAALIRVLDDPKSSPTALASAARTVVDMAGLTKPSDDDRKKEPHEMNADELAERIAALRKANAENDDDDDDDEGVFG